MTPISPKIPIVALHGFTGSGADFSPLVAATSTQLAWWTPDLPGHGGNLPEDANFYSFSGALEALEAQIRARRLEQFILLGYSMGARLALMLAKRMQRQIAALVLIGVHPGIEGVRERELRRSHDAILADDIVRHGAHAFLEKWQRSPLIASQKKNIPVPIWKEMQVRRQQLTSEGLQRSLLGIGIGEQPTQWRNLSSLSVPTWLVTGETDHKFRDIARRMKCLMPSALHFEISNSGHAAHLENIPEFSDVLRINVLTFGP